MIGKKAQAHVFVLGFAAFPGIATKRFTKLIQTFGTAEKAWHASDQEIINVLGISLGHKCNKFRKQFDVLSCAENLQKKGISWYVPSDQEYPHLLQQVPTPPFVLFAKGNVSLLQREKTIGIVGTRKVSSYGRQVTSMFTRELVGRDFTIVSGMALGVDGIAHEEALRCNSSTIAVLGSGVDVPTPREHTLLYQKILEKNGLIVSTFFPGEDASKGSFPARNAIIAGLSQGVLVTEGAADSGSLITAGYAKQFGRPLFAVPGQITSSLSEGTNTLIRHGAVSVSSIHDIIDALDCFRDEVHSITKESSQSGRQTENRQERARTSHNPIEQRILILLENESLLFDEIVRKMGKDSKSIGAALSLMELQGLIHSGSDGKYFIDY